MLRTRLYREQHGRIRLLTRPLLSSTRNDSTAPALRSALAKLAGAVKIHLRDEDAKLYPLLLASTNAEVRNTAIEFQQTMGTLAREFAAFYETWVKPDAIEQNRGAFFGDVDAVLRKLARRMDLEDGRLYELVDRHAGDSSIP